MNRTPAIFDRFAQDDRFEGFGYIGERARHLSSTDPEAPARPEQVALADEAVLAIAESFGWSDERFFEWANSRPGRWFADTAIANGDVARALREF